MASMKLFLSILVNKPGKAHNDLFFEPKTAWKRCYLSLTIWQISFQDRVRETVPFPSQRDCE